MTDILLIITAYLVGSFPSAYLVGRIFNKGDIRKQGSGNVGAMNTYRVAGLLPGIITVILDILKGVLPVALALTFTGNQAVIFACGILAVLGHNYSIFLRFKGGKGLATTFGVFIVLSPLTIVFTAIVAVVLGLLLKDANTAFGSAALSIPVILWFQYGQLNWVIFGLLAAVIIVIRHIPDYRAYLGGRRKLR